MHICALAVALALASACGSGPGDATLTERDQGLAEANPLHSWPSYERSSNDYQRPTRDQQSSPATPTQGLSEHGAAPGVAGGDVEAFCDALCAAVEATGCGDGCTDGCVFLASAPRVCMDVFSAVVDCIARSSRDCEDASEACAVEYAGVAVQCAAFFEDD